ncbi:MAG: hypothetical protein WCE75_14410 [Terracidiphilus sp.]
MRFFKTIKKDYRLDNADEFDLAADLKRVRAQNRSWIRYWKHLDGISARLGPKAYDFFRIGKEEEGLRDAYLLSLNLGDAIDLTESSCRRLRFDREPSIVSLTALNYEKTRLHQFVFKLPRKVVIDIPSSDPLFPRPGVSFWTGFRL